MEDQLTKGPKISEYHCRYAKGTFNEIPVVRCYLEDLDTGDTAEGRLVQDVEPRHWEAIFPEPNAPHGGTFRVCVYDLEGWGTFSPHFTC
jgi:hypothetical protein